MKDTVKLITGHKPLMVAHRGVSGLEKENTNAAFVAAGNRSYYGIETDTYRTIDGEYVCIHHWDVIHVGFDDVDVKKCTLDLLRNIRLKGVDGEESRGDIRIPTLREYIRICHHYGKVAVLELKQDFPKEQLEEILGILAWEGHLEQTVFIAFGLNNLIRLREILPEQPMQYLIGTNVPEDLPETLNKYHLDLDIDYRALTPELAERVHADGHKINVWTVNSLDAAEPMIRMNVDFITTNILE